LILLISEKF